MYCNRDINGIAQNLYYHTAKLNVIYLLRFLPFGIYFVIFMKSKDWKERLVL